VKTGEQVDLDPQSMTEIVDSFEESDADYAITFFYPVSKEELETIKKSNAAHFYKIYIRIQDTCVFKKVRLFIILRALNKVGQICASHPEPNLLTNAKFEWDFDVFMISKESSNTISNVLDEILEIENKVITNVNFKEFSKEITNVNLIKKPQVEGSVYFEEEEEIEMSEEIVERDNVSSIEKDFSSITGQITSVKVSFDVLEKLMNNFGEVVILKNQLSQFLKEKQDWEINRLFDNMDKHFLEIQEIIFKLKLVRVESTFRKYKRLVRDLAKETGKEIKLVLEGMYVEIDRKILEELNSPIIHLLRNAIYHGIETPRQRMMVNKEKTGTLRLKTYRRAGSIFIEVSDDGKGIDYDKIRQKLIEKGMFSPDEVMELTKDDLNMQIFTPGFSTLAGADMVSGRGMGLAIVSEKVKELGGTLELYSEKNNGSTFRVTVPFTRAILKAQLIKVGGDLFAIPIEYIKQIYFFNRELVEYVKGEEYYRMDNVLIPIVRLERYLDYMVKKTDEKESNSHHDVAIWCQKDEDSSALLIVNDVLQQMEVVIKPFRSKFSEFNEILGVSITGEGNICLIIDVLNIISSLTRDSQTVELVETTSTR
jgi:two-component system chemotaxis sensor kinase CheA